MSPTFRFRYLKTILVRQIPGTDLMRETVEMPQILQQWWKGETNGGGEWRNIKLVMEYRNELGELVRPSLANAQAQGRAEPCEARRSESPAAPC